MRIEETKHAATPPQEPPAGGPGPEQEPDPALAAHVDAALRALPQFAPARDFQVRVLAQLRIRKFAWTRFRAWLTGSSCAVPDPFGALLEGSLSRRQARALAAFVAVDPGAGAAVADRMRLAERLGHVPSLGPRLGFADRVMARVPVAPLPFRRRALARARAQAAKLLPGRKERLAAACGLALGPVALFGIAVAVLSDPLVAVANVAGFAWTKVGALAPGLAGASVGALEDVAAGGGIGVAAPVVVTGLVVFAGLAVLSGWILYRNLVKAVAMEQQHTHVPV